mgnify:CR=1 FL=1
MVGIEEAVGQPVDQGEVMKLQPGVRRKLLAILKLLSQQTEPMGASKLARQLEQQGVVLSERAVRYYLKIADDLGYTQLDGRSGRVLTPPGEEELQKSSVADKVGFMLARVQSLSYQSDFDPQKGEGQVILNVSYIPEAKFSKAIKLMAPVFRAKFCMSSKIAVARAGEILGRSPVPEKYVGIGTVCSVATSAIMLKAGIPVDPLYGGLLEIEQRVPSRFVELISYAGCSLDPLEVFIRSRMTSVRSASRTGNGVVGASFREAPAAAYEKLLSLTTHLERIGVRGMAMIGQPSQPVLEVPVALDRIGFVVYAGLNPVAALEEARIETKCAALSTLYEWGDLVDFFELL